MTHLFLLSSYNGQLNVYKEKKRLKTTYKELFLSMFLLFDVNTRLYIPICLMHFTYLHRLQWRLDLVLTSFKIYCFSMTAAFHEKQKYFYKTFFVYKTFLCKAISIDEFEENEE